MEKRTFRAIPHDDIRTAIAYEINDVFDVEVGDIINALRKVNPKIIYDTSMMMVRMDSGELERVIDYVGKEDYGVPFRGVKSDASYRLCRGLRNLTMTNSDIEHYLYSVNPPLKGGKIVSSTALKEVLSNLNKMEIEIKKRKIYLGEFNYRLSKNGQVIKTEYPYIESREDDGWKALEKRLKKNVIRGTIVPLKEIGETNYKL